MTTKNVPNKHDMGTAAALTRLFDQGNFWLLRKVAHKVLATHPSDKDKQLALHMLKVSTPDALALLAGCLCLCMTIIVAFMSAY